ncbi:fatty acid-binding protein, liver-like [Pelobates fuscus]|uniref:fatty acid-binding protein, liver-like n=1 Tax=Pelobates fuscus TaxID=191477 RepID=UPI002FE4841F
MDFNGTYVLETQENFVPFMRAIGLPEDIIERGKDLKSVTEIVQNGNHFVFTVTTGPRILRNEFTAGEEAEVEAITGENVKTVVNVDGNKLLMNLKGIIGVSEVVGDTLTNTMTFKDIVYKSVCKRA